MLNKVIVEGYLVNDPETRTAKTGTLVAKFRIANKDGERTEYERTEYIPVTCFGDLAEEAKGYRKGAGVHVEGRFETSRYEKNGEMRYFTQVIARSIEPYDAEEQEPF